MDGIILYLIVINVVAFLAFGLDKLKAKADAWRIPEKTLLGLAITGGSVGYNKAGANAGGIYVSRTGTLNMQGGSVHHNSCPRNGGGVFLNNAKFHFSGGDISFNKTETAAGGILAGSSSLVMPAPPLQRRQ